MMPAHYALSDAAIVLVAVWAGLALWRNGQRLPAMVMACFAVPAAIGVIRFGGGLQGEFAGFHSGASLMLGLAGAAVLAFVCLQRIVNRDHWLLAGGILVCAAAVFLLAKPLLAPLFIVALVVALGAALWGSVRLGASWLVPAGVVILLVNVLLIRRAPWLGEAMAWHAYHVLIAVALALVGLGLLSDPHRVGVVRGQG
jgi:hypothetical protein